MKTILQALKDQVPGSALLGDGHLEGVITKRGLANIREVSRDVYELSEWKGACADCFLALVTVPDQSESDMSIKLPDRGLLLKQANALYSSIGEPEVRLSLPNVYVGWGN